MTIERRSDTSRSAAADATMDTRLRDAIAGDAAHAEEVLADVCRRFGGPRPLPEAMEYAVLGGGKRLRPVMTFAACRATGGQREDAEAAAVAIELVHAYSLVHDDLPAMDDDDVRRGRPTVHVVYGEANAILVGDALQAAAFEVLATAPRLSDARKAECIRALAAGAGGRGMVGGQVSDMGMEGGDETALLQMHAAKTGALFVAACRMGAVCAGATPDVVDRLAGFAAAFGEAFQVGDDLVDFLDLDPDDTHEASVNLAAVLGPDAAVARVRLACDAARETLRGLGGDCATLCALVDWVDERATDAARRLSP